MNQPIVDFTKLSYPEKAAYLALFLNKRVDITLIRKPRPRGTIQGRMRNETVVAVNKFKQCIRVLEVSNHGTFESSIYFSEIESIKLC